MKRLMHPVRGIREPFGTAGLIVAIVALVAALAGGAYAASGGLTGKQKKEVEKIAKKYSGQPGATGGSGAAGAKGDAGAPGANGTNGAAGTAGTSPSGTNFTGTKTVGSVTCTEGGTEYKGATTNLVCNGKKGETGFTESLPSGKTETGNWSATGFYSPGVELPSSAISYSIPLAVPSEKVVYLNQAQTAASTTTPIEGCKLDTSTPSAKPVAPAGTLCVFTREVEQGTFKFIGESAVSHGDSTTGAFIWFQPSEITPELAAMDARGTWAVTAK